MTWSSYLPWKCKPSEESFSILSLPNLAHFLHLCYTDSLLPCSSQSVADTRTWGQHGRWHCSVHLFSLPENFVPAVMLFLSCIICFSLSDGLFPNILIYYTISQIKNKRQIISVFISILFSSHHPFSLICLISKFLKELSKLDVLFPPFNCLSPLTVPIGNSSPILSK